MKNNLKLTELCKKEMSRVIGGDEPCRCGCTCSCPSGEYDAGYNGLWAQASGYGRTAKGVKN